MIKYSILFLLVGTGLMIFVMMETGATLKTPATPKGILDLEFAYNTGKLNTILNAWAPAAGVDNIRAAKTNTWLDFIFLYFYSLFLFFSCKKIGRISEGFWLKASVFIANGALWAGLLDIIENAGMLYTLSGHISSGVALLTTISAAIKWALALLAVLYCLLGLIYVTSKGKLKSLLG